MHWFGAPAKGAIHLFLNRAPSLVGLVSKLASSQITFVIARNFLSTGERGLGSPLLFLDALLFCLGRHGRKS
jgi:hypothetical protein